MFVRVKPNTFFYTNDERIRIMDDCVAKVLRSIPYDNECERPSYDIETPFGTMNVWESSVTVEEREWTDEELHAQPCWEETCRYCIGDIVVVDHCGSNLVGVVTNINKALLRIEFGESRWSYRYFRQDKVKSIQEHLGLTDYVCGQCGQIIPDFDLRHIVYHMDMSNETITVVSLCCDECRSNMRVCRDCGRLFDDESELYSVEHHGDICSYCWEGGEYCYCDECGLLFCNEDVHVGESECICDRCFDRCGYATCANCGDLLGPEESYYDEREDDVFCYRCYMDRPQAEPTHIHNYTYSPTPHFWGAAWDSGLLFMGVELEIDGSENVTECSDALYEIGRDESLFYMKRDGSLDATGTSDNGIEIVTHPCTFDFHMSEFPWAQITDIAREHGYRSHDTNTCGLHVHISREALGDSDDSRDLTIAKMLLLMDTFWDKMVIFSRRDASKLQRWACKPNCEMTKDDTLDSAMDKYKKYASKKSHYDRYKAINLCNYNTVEFRLFRGSLKPQTILAALQMVRNFVDFSMTHSLLEVQCAKWMDLVNQHRYAELVGYLVERGLIEEEGVNQNV